MYILYTYIANIRLIASTPQHRDGQFNCWWRFPVFSLLPFTNFQLKVPYYFLLASGIKYLPPNISEKFISSIGYKSFNNCLSKGTLSTPPACSYAIWTRERKKVANPTFGSCAIQILKTGQFWRGVAFLFAYTVDWRYSQPCFGFVTYCRSDLFLWLASPTFFDSAPPRSNLLILWRGEGRSANERAGSILPDQW